MGKSIYDVTPEDNIGLEVEKFGIERIAPNEVFVRILDDDEYFVSNYGRCLSLRMKPPRILKVTKKNNKPAYNLFQNRSGNLRARLFIAEKLVADNFLRNWSGHTILLHYDGDVTNNVFDNLVWISKQEQLYIKSGKLTIKELRDKRATMYKTAEEIMAKQANLTYRPMDEVKPEQVESPVLNRYKLKQMYKNMVARCTSEKYKSKHPTYKDGTLSEQWQGIGGQINFEHWVKENYYTVGFGRMELDKDILVKGNKVYGPDTCVFVPDKINSIFTTVPSNGLPVGVREAGNGKYIAAITIDNKGVNLGTYDTPEEAFAVYKRHKEAYITYLADSLKSRIPARLYDAMINWKVEITD